MHAKKPYKPIGVCKNYKYFLLPLPIVIAHVLNGWPPAVLPCMPAWTSRVPKVNLPREVYHPHPKINSSLGAQEYPVKHMFPSGGPSNIEENNREEYSEEYRAKNDQVVSIVDENRIE